MPVLYRGITLDLQTADADRAAIRQTGQLAAKSVWKNTMASPREVRSRSSELAPAPGKVRDEIHRLPQTPLSYACGDFEGAARYALSGRGTPVVIAFETPWTRSSSTARTSSIPSSSSGTAAGPATGTG